MSFSSEFSVIRSVQSLLISLLQPLDQSCTRLSLPKRAIILELPDELLWGIFSRCMNPHSSPFSTENPLWPIMQVCVRWRAIVLDAPQFWRHISFPDWQQDKKLYTTGEFSRDGDRAALQVVRSGQVPVTLNLLPVPGNAMTESDHVLDVFFTASARLEAATLILNKHLFHRFCTQPGGFPALRKLVVRLSDGIDNAEAAEAFFGGLTALVHLHLVNQVTPDWVSTLVPLKSMWNRLRVCELTECKVDDVLLILPHFSPGTLLSLILGRFTPTGEPDSLAVVDHCNIQALSFHRCDDEFIARIVENMTAPLLQRLALWWYGDRAHLDTITAMLRRSSASLTHFAMRLLSVGSRRTSLDVGTMTDLFAFLDCEHVQGLLDLDLTLVSRYSPSTIQLLNALAHVPSPSQPEIKLPVLPKLRSLALRGYDEEDFEWEKRLLAIAASRKPVFESLWLDDPLLNPSLHHRALETLRKKLGLLGVELVCSYDGDMGTW
ncbi:hypothetical protein C8F01DRAFT_1365446 [Mycena amicta]|nr:hypothetical protein C8F01DRAFT_1365446 [Mycena amicta]